MLSTASTVGTEDDGARGEEVRSVQRGARLPEQLSRLLFLEGMVAGRRVLEVGATSSAVAGFLLELGATRVVCAVQTQSDGVVDTSLLEHLRNTNDRDRVDFRAIRNPNAATNTGSRPPGSVPVLPGEDGAFDLVIDFTLPQALARGEDWRLSDIERVLSATSRRSRRRGARAQWRASASLRRGRAPAEG